MGEKIQGATELSNSMLEVDLSLLQNLPMGASLPSHTAYFALSASLSLSLALSCLNSFPCC